MQPSGQVGMSSAVRASVYQHFHQGSYQRGTQIVMPPRSAFVDLVEQLRNVPPTENELNLLTDVVHDIEEQDLTLEQIEARLTGTRLGPLLRLLVEHRQDVIGVLALLLMLVQLFSDRHPPKAEPTPPSPVPQVSVTINVPTDELVDELIRRLEEERCDDEGK